MLTHGGCRAVGETLIAYLQVFYCLAPDLTSGSFKRLARWLVRCFSRVETPKIKVIPPYWPQQLPDKKTFKKVSRQLSGKGRIEASELSENADYICYIDLFYILK